MADEDLNFLDDLDIDELAEWLNKCKDTSIGHNSTASTSEGKTDKDLITNEPIIQNEDDESSNKNAEILNNNPKDNISSSKANISEDNEIINRFKASLKKINLCKYDEQLAISVLKRIKQKFHEEYKISSLIHCGKYSKLFKCKDPAGKCYAVKILNDIADNCDVSKEKEKLLLQIQCDVPENHNFCVSFRAGFSLKGSWCFFMDFYPLTLEQVLREAVEPFDIYSVQNLARQLVDAVTVLKYNHIIHSDIKPSHILMNSSRTVLKLCGFDDAYYIQSSHKLTNIGTLNYRSPEIILGHSASFSIDIWSTATVLYEIATSQILFPGLSNNDILYEQMCLLGDLPDKMLEKSSKKHKYFTGNKFKRTCNFSDMIVTMDRRQFYSSNKITSAVFSTHFKYHYNVLASEKEFKKYKNKIYSFLNLIQKMLVFAPEDRITMDAVYTDPFIYARFN